MNNVIAVVISYNSGEDLILNLESILQQVNKIIIVDNASDFTTIQIIRDLCSKYPDSVLAILNDQNIGLAKAQNIGIDKALTYDSDWVMIFDDDSILCPLAVDSMIMVYNSIQNNKHIVMLVPNVIEKNVKKISKYITKKSFYIKRISFEKNSVIRNILTAIASGSLIRADYLINGNRMNEDFFIDYIDIDFSLKINQLGFEIVAVEQSQIIHTLGSRKISTVLGKNILTNNHMPFRRYYIYRNRLIVWNKYWNIYFIYVLYDFLVSIFEGFKIIILEQNKIKNFSNILKGLVHGIQYCFKK